MNIVFNKLFKIDIGADEVVELNAPEDAEDLREYIVALLGKIITNKDKKAFEFESETTEVQRLIKDVISVKTLDDYDKPFLEIAKRLHRKEKESEKKNNLGVPPVQGILVISVLQDEDNKQRFVISKADYNEFLDVGSYRKRDGVPIRKKVYKAFLASLDNKQIEKVAVYDTNPSFTVYWYRDFLELKKVHSDEYNTEELFKIIEAKVLNPLKKNYKADYFELWNASVRYFRAQDEFDLEHYVEELLVKHKSLTEGLDLTPHVNKLRDAVAKAKVDTRFTIKSNVINKRLKKTISLTPQIDLNIKDGIPDLDKTIKSFQEENGAKWIMIKTEHGFEYFKDNEIMTNE